MPQLPDLRAKIKVDFSDLAGLGVQAKLVGETLQRELSGTRASSVDSSMRQIGNSVDEAGRKMSNAGTAFIKWGDSGQTASLRISSATARTKSDFDELERRTKALGYSLDNEFRKGTSAVIRLGDDGSAALGNVSRQMSATSVAGTQAAGGLFSMGTAGLVLVGVGIALAAVLAPLVVTLAAFAVGLAAVLTVMALGAAAVAGLAGGIIVLAAATQGWVGVTQTVPQAQQAVASATLAHQQAVLALHNAQTTYNATSTHTAAQTLALQQAQQKVTDTTNAMTKAQQDLTAAQTAGHNPLQQLKDDAKAMADTLGAQAAPMAGLLLGWIDKLVPRIQELGQSLLTWFGSRLPGILKGASDVADQFFGALEGLGGVLGKFLDQVGARAPQFTALFGQMLGVGIDAIDGLLTNLLRLSDWFIARLPTYGPVVAAVFSFIGSTVQFLGRVFGAIADWFVANWPFIISSIQGLWAAIVQGWKFASPILEQVKGALATMGPTFQFIKDHAENLKPVLAALGAVIVVLIAALAGVAVVIYVAVLAIVAIGTAITWFVNWVKSQLPEAGAQFSALGDRVNKMKDGIGAAFSWIGTKLHEMVVWIQDQIAEGGRQFDALGRAGDSLRDWLGRIFSAIGSGAQGMTQVVGSAFSGLGGIVHGALVAVGSVFDKFGGLVNGALGGFGIHINPINFGNAPFAQGPSGVHSLAQGGVIPGYAPGIDSVPAMLSPGEGILTPQTVRGLGGPAGIAALNQGGVVHGLGAAIDNVSALGSMIGSIMGQCVVAVEKWTGHFFPVAFASQMTAWINSRTPSPGSIFVSTIPPFGHTGIVLDGTRVIDSNWGLDERVRIHNLSDIPSIAGYISGYLGSANLGGLLGAAGLSLGSILKGLISPLAGIAHTAANAIPEAWARPLVNSLIDKVVSNVEGRAGGGPVVPGHLYTVGERGPELFSPSTAGQIIPTGGVGNRDDDIVQVLVSIDGRLAEFTGKPRLAPQLAMQKWG